MFFKRKQKPGFTLPEVIIAVMILSMTSVASVNLIIFLMQFAELNNNSVIATNLAREGIEIVRNQRDTNWMRWGGSLRESWDNGFDGATDIKGEIYAYPGDIVPASPTVDLNTRYFYFLGDRSAGQSVAGPITLELWKATDSANEIEDILDESAAFGTNDGLHRLYYNPDQGFVHDTLANEETDFYRVIEVSYYQADYVTTFPEGATPSSADNMYSTNDANTAKVRSIVGYKHNGRWKYITLETYLTDWYMRDSQNDDT